MLKWYLITAQSDEAGRNVMKSLRNEHLMVRRRDGKLYACISNHHQVWLSKVCQDFSAQLRVLEEAPVGLNAPSKEEYITPCGEKFYDPVQYSHHFSTCIKCSKSAKAKVVAKLEPGVEHDLNGVIASIEVIRDQMWEKVETMDELLSNLKVYRDSKEKLTGLNEEVTKRIEAVRMLLREGKL